MDEFNLVQYLLDNVVAIALVVLVVDKLILGLKKIAGKTPTKYDDLIISVIEVVIDALKFGFNKIKKTKGIKSIALFMTCFIFSGCLGLSVQLKEPVIDAIDEIVYDVGLYMAMRYPDRKIEYSNYCDNMLKASEIRTQELFDEYFDALLLEVKDPLHVLFLKRAKSKVYVDGAFKLEVLHHYVKIFQDGLNG